jgi:hypothetical protein
MTVDLVSRRSRERGGNTKLTVIPAKAGIYIPEDFILTIEIK